jgi:hypothetical protein
MLRLTTALVKFLLAGSALAVMLVLLVQIQLQARHRVLATGTSSTSSASSASSSSAAGTQDPSTMHTNTAFSACLVLEKEQDYPYLTEWIAYHWHVLPLRQLVLWNDPSITAGPALLASILGPWAQKMDITVWDHPVQIYPAGHPQHKLLLQRQRQRQPQDQPQDHHDRIQNRNHLQTVFLGKCLRTLQRQGHSWTILGRVDEYALINPRVRNATDPLYQQWKELPVPDQKEPGSVMTWLQQTQNASVASTFSQPCLPLTSKQFGTRENDRAHTSAWNASLQPASSLWKSNSNATIIRLFSPDNFLTLTWQYWGHPEHHVKAPRVHTHVLDLSRISPSLLHWKVDAHMPVSICPREALHERDNPLVSHHYSGTMEQLAFGDKKTATTHLSRETRLHTDTIHNTYWEGNVIPQWLEGFVASVGEPEAKRLLQFVGHGH